ncbi:putative short-chain dehydrogenase/reductase family protein [Thozetella sp. PMI_491]|nr:putative short-chain dehydrogenase/reductase family protein [Thozetella sp. PMI_491]
MSANLGHDAAWEGGGLAFLYRQLFVSPQPVPSSVNLVGKTVVVTGANTGLGLEAVRQFLQLKASRAILAVRSTAKGEAVASPLRKEFPNAQIDVMNVDMASYASIESFAKECESLERLDIAILNAGIQAPHFERNAETGHQSTFQVNYLSTTLLARLLVPLMKAKTQDGEPARLSIIASDMAYSAKLDGIGPIIPHCDKEQGWDEYQSYSDSKLSLIAGVMTLAEQVSADEVIINAVNPGLVTGTTIKKKTGEMFFDGIIVPAFIKALGRSIKNGASIYVYGAVVQGKESHGSFVSDWTIKPYPGFLYTEKGKEFKTRLWEETAEELRVHLPRHPR